MTIAVDRNIKSQTKQNKITYGIIDKYQKSHMLAHMCYLYIVLLDFLVTVKAASHECVIRTGQF